MRSDGGPADLKKTEGQGHEHLCHTSMHVRNGNLGSDRTTTTKAVSVRKQLGPKNSKSNEGRQAKNGGVKGRDGSAEELNRERLVRSRLQWAGHVARVADDRLPNRAAELIREQGRRRRGRPRLLICIGSRRGCQGRRPEPKTMDDSKQTANWGRSVQSIHEEVGTGGQGGM